MLLTRQARKELIEPSEVADTVAFGARSGGTLLHGLAARDGQRLDGKLAPDPGRHRATGILEATKEII